MQKQQWNITGNQGIYWAYDPAFTESGRLLQGFVCRQGGVSQGAYESLNISYSTDDDIDNIRENRRRLAQAMGFPLESWAGIRQVHGNHVVLVGKEEAGAGVLDPEVLRVKADGQITNIPGVTLVTQHADCVPLYFWDPVNNAIGLSHAGWQGTVSNIAGETVKAMAKAFGTKTEDLRAGIGPSAGPCHYEVDEPVIQRFVENFGQMVLEKEKILKPSPNQGRAMLDLWQANLYLLLQHGLKIERISVSGFCTMCHSDKFFSHRCRAKGRQAAILRINN